MRFFWGGFLGGLSSFIFHGHKEAKGTVMASVRLSMDSFWKVGVKKGWWRGVKWGGDVMLFTVGLGVINVVYDADREAVDDEMVARGIRFLRGEGRGRERIKKADYDEEEDGVDVKGEEEEQRKKMD